MTPQNDAYQKIAEMWTFPNSESFRKMLGTIMTLEEAELLLECTSPVTVHDLAARLKTDEKSLKEKLDDLFKRALIFRGPTQYQFRRGRHFGFAGNIVPLDMDEYKQWLQ